MTQDELTALLTEKYEFVPQVCDMPTEAMLTEITRWMHIDQPGFAKGDLLHMIEECGTLIQMLQRTAWALGDLARDAHDDDEDC